MTDNKVTRRQFVEDGGRIGLGVMIVPRHVLGGIGYQAPSDTMNFAVVGFGGMGSENALELAKTENLVAFADVDFAFSESKVAEKLKDDQKKDRPEGITLKQKFDKAARSRTSAKCSRSRRTSTASSSPLRTTSTPSWRRRRCKVASTSTC